LGGLSITQFLEQPRILYRDHRLVGECSGQLDFLLSESFDMRAIDHEYPDQRLLSAEYRVVAFLDGRHEVSVRVSGLRDCKRRTRSMVLRLTDVGGVHGGELVTSSGVS
jgi:hypothetical protein